ncbi:MAG: protein translocase subunit SecF [Gemmatimonadetes bacterium]|nr:protein translocase subunit SecF [Gemmatimonadota bacterium]
MRLFEHADYHFIEKRKRAYVLSAIVVLIGMGAMIANQFTIGSWLNYGVDFTGGSLVQVRFNETVEAQQVRAAVPEAEEVTAFGGSNEYVIRTMLAEGQPVENLKADIQEELARSFGEGTFEIVRTELVGPKVGAELERTAALALLTSFLLTLIYLAFRYEWRFGLAAILATGHDILITLGALALFRVEISLTSVAAVLTVVGFSLHDTIIVFDRIREDLKKKGGRKSDLVALINRAINETLPRTVLTVATVMAVLVALLVLGPPVLRSFTLVLTLGIAVGVFSSIFVASPLLVEIQKRWGTGAENKEKKRRPEPAAV